MTNKHIIDLVCLRCTYDAISGTLYVWRDADPNKKVKESVLSQVYDDEKELIDAWYPWKWHGVKVVGEKAAADKYDYHIHFEDTHFGSGGQYEKILYLFFKARWIAKQFPNLKFMLRFTRNDIDLRFEIHHQKYQNLYQDKVSVRSVIETVRRRRDEIDYTLAQLGTRYNEI